ncbi:hypothetical protein OHU11_14050 [Streptomyces sp. NBC_00257]|uniref:hypothetical protein n=1 Tax=unclassified Streptomyces TaxID=2593676 RepID=UPI00224E5727|nr:MULTISPECIES: hypothetical protein [unclassified Streptomyces]WTB56978.1 hypothetical protein OG832_29370 [Streptomyces sp. NBC_00826]WTH90138.1 hypothetical protein OIC43_14325 [Streptomyces sp. NBC_00825]WTH98867.1 hypothetical protein OHA23_14310 [Streptomyces sp. NBC_00822]MCX4864264.1 hypothetical protein [Streptomyces sp. NBC_00906]MCX4895502.1 hypothetical protein [Streptomyces sp. NBC_00892]
MYAYRLHELHAAELRRRAEQDRLVREALRARRAARRSGQKEAEGPVSTDRKRFVHAA